MKKSKLNDILFDSDLFRIFRKDTSINLLQSYKIEYKYTQHHFTLLADKYHHLSAQVSKEIQDNFDEVFLSQLEDCREDYLDGRDVIFTKSTIDLFNYLIHNKYDFIISNPVLVRNFFDSEHFNPASAGRVSRNAYYYGKLMDRIDLFGCHSIHMDKDLIICGRRSGCSYNFYLDSAHILEDENDCEVKVKYFLDMNINKEDFVNLYLIRDNNPKYKCFFRDVTINDLLD